MTKLPHHEIEAIKRFLRTDLDALMVGIDSILFSQLYKADLKFKMSDVNGVRGPAKSGYQPSILALVPRWLIEAAEKYIDDGGYADMELGEYLARLVEETND